ncbi:MAG: Rnase Y domain-containing protein, partial [Actinomycetota bacterium]|nr:Rnase Y domain-containing protein [Actinomycetota bacterium]
MTRSYGACAGTEEGSMEIALAALVAAAVSAGVVLAMGRGRGAAAARPGTAGGRRRPDGHENTPRRSPAPASDGAAAPVDAASQQAGEELHARRAELARLEERLRAKEAKLDGQLSDLAEREQSLGDRERNLDRRATQLDEGRTQQVRELERLAGLSSGQAKQLLMRELEDEVRHESARLTRQVEEETKHDAERRARSILSTVMQRVAGSHAIETTVSVVELRSDELKGRIIGREGRNIRALESLTGIDFIIDDTPGAVLLSGFDGVRREIARLTLEKLLSDGRIHPARIEEAYGQACTEIDHHVVEVGERAVYEANVGALRPELTKLLGRLHYRTSYGQNVLAHSIECARLAALLGAELGA